MLIATHNPGKVREYRQLLLPLSNELIGLDELAISDEVEETGSTFAENALIKARAFALRTGHATLADDSGLEVAALGGRPGVLSARYAGPGATDEDRIRLLLWELEGVSEDRRQGRFRCAIAVAWPDGRCALVTAKCAGTIAFEPHGSSGFGYDPVFVVPQYGKTMAELSSEIKNELSHRARAARALLTIIDRCWAG
jgi:XTP/dITP diphosphohydrolase